MKLSTDQIEQIRDKKGLEPFSTDYPPLEELGSLLGDHTFYLTANGLHIWEYANVPEADGQLIVALEVASWRNIKRFDITTHKPRITEITVLLEENANGKAVRYQ